MKNLFLSLAAILLSCSMAFAQAPDGLTCENAIPVDTSYIGTIHAAGTYYYSASTYDLPMTCYFYPAESGLGAPEIYADFTCTPGVYDDPNLAEMILSASGWGITTPIKFPCNYSEDSEGREFYYLTINESYREIMATFNITYNVDAIVQVTVPCAGEVRLRPDTTFKSCVESSEWLTMPDTIITGVQHESDSYVFPMAEWMNDSIRFRWTGSQSPATVWIGETCDFSFSTEGENAALDMFVLQPDTTDGANIRNLTKQDMNDFLTAYGQGGVYYLRVVCAEEGELILEKKPMNEAMADAIELEINEPQSIATNATEQVYYFPLSWTENNMIFTSSSSKPVTAYFSVVPEFEADKTSEYVIDSYDFVPTASGRELALSKKQLRAIGEYAEYMNSEHLFVIFVSATPTTIKPILWSAGDCVGNADEIFVNDSIRLQRNSSTTAWRVNIDQWAKYDMQLFWKGSSAIKIYLCDTCKGFSLSKTNEHVKIYKEIKVNTDGTRDTLLLSKDELAAAAAFADADGYLYFRFNNTATSSLIVTHTPDPTVDPIEPTSSCVINSIELKKGDQLTLNLDSAFTVYRIKYDEWVATGASLNWTGAEALHTFVAETCTFAVAPYNKYVHAYIPVPANGNTVLDTATLTDMAEFVDEDGYLYIRFLTEFEGTLSVQ